MPVEHHNPLKTSKQSSTEETTTTTTTTKYSTTEPSGSDADSPWCSSGMPIHYEKTFDI
jgi:hypothetical protein